MDLMALGIAFLVTIVCSILVFFISVYGTKEVSFEENLKASQIPGNSNKKKKRCGVCDGCKRPNCGACIYCKDLKMFGGPGKQKQACLNRICENMK